MIEEGPRYQRAAEAACTICNLLAGEFAGGKAELYGRVLFAILAAMYAAQEDLGWYSYKPSEN